MSKTVIAPIVALVLLVLKALFGIELDEGMVMDVVDKGIVFVSGVVTLYGIIRNHKKK